MSAAAMADQRMRDVAEIARLQERAAILEEQLAHLRDENARLRREAIERAATVPAMRRRTW